MIVCKKCGTHDEDDATFCGVCGAFLEWEGEHIDDPGTVAPPAPAPVAPPAAGPAGPRSPTAGPPPPGGPGALSSGPVRPGMPMPPAMPAAPRESTAVRAEGSFPPPPPSASTPGAVLPQAPRVVHQVTEAIGGPSAPPTSIPGGIACWNCALENPPDRRFCRRCGTSLYDRPAPPAPVKQSWWRRLLGRPAPSPSPEAASAGTAPDGAAPGGAAAAPGTATAAGPGGGWPAAGAPHAPHAPKAPSLPKGKKPPNLPKTPKGFGKPQRGVGAPTGRRSIAGKSILLLVVVVIVVGLVVPGIRNKVRNAIDPTYHPVALAEPIPSGVAKCSDATIPHTHLSPDNTTLYWVTGPVGATPQSVTVSFASPTSINRVRVSSNVESSSAATAGAIPHPLQLQFATGAAAAVTETLSDPPQNVQAVSLSVPEPTTVRITLVAADPGAVAGSCAETAFIFDHKN